MRRAAIGTVFVGLVTALLVGVPAAPALAAPGPPGHTEWWFDSWNVPGLWAGGARGQGITIGEIDTGVNASLPELAANVLPGNDLGSAGGDGRVDRDVEDFGHGTAMASLMVAHDGQDNILGLAPDAKVLPVAVPITGTTDDAGDLAHSDLVTAIHWAADHGAKIISMSLGASVDPDPTTLSCPSDEQDAVNYALEKGVIVVAASGNSGDKGSPIEEPGVCLGVISVGAVDVAGNVPVWSSRHPYLTLIAPGVNVPSIGRIPGQAFFGDGTSQATALTSAGLALIWSKYPQLTGPQVTARLLATLDAPHSVRDPATGFGNINIGAAINRDVPVTAPNAVADGVDPFLAKAKATAPADPSVRPATTRRDFPGTYAVADPPGPLAAGPGLVGVVLGSAGLLALIVLLMIVIRRRRPAAPVYTFPIYSPGHAPPPGSMPAPGSAQGTVPVPGPPYNAYPVAGPTPAAGSYPGHPGHSGHPGYAGHPGLVQPPAQVPFGASPIQPTPAPAVPPSELPKPVDPPATLDE